VRHLRNIEGGFPCINRSADQLSRVIALTSCRFGHQAHHPARSRDSCGLAPDARRSFAALGTTTFSARWYRSARSVALRVLCAAPRVALRALYAVPDVVLRVPFAVPAAAPCQTLAPPWTAWRAWCWSGLQRVTPSELQARPQLQMRPR